MFQKLGIYFLCFCLSGCMASDFMGIIQRPSDAEEENIDPCWTASAERECATNVYLETFLIEDWTGPKDTVYDETLAFITTSIVTGSCSDLPDDCDMAFLDVIASRLCGGSLYEGHENEGCTNADLMMPYFEECESITTTLDDILSSEDCSSNPDPTEQTCFDLKETHDCTNCVAELDPAGLAAYQTISFDTCFCPDEVFGPACEEVCADSAAYFANEKYPPQECVEAGDTSQLNSCEDAFTSACTASTSCARFKNSIEQCQ